MTYPFIESTAMWIPRHWPRTSHRPGALISSLITAAVLATALPVLAGQPKAGPLSALAAESPAAQPVERLMIQYKLDAKLPGASAASPQDGRATAAARVAQSAGLAQAPGLRFLRSVAPQLHVAGLDQPLSADQAQALVERLRADPAVAAVEIDRRVRPHAVTDPFFLNPASSHPQWHLQSPALVAGGINASAAWANSTGTGVVVAVLDGGYRPHRDLVGNLLVPGYDFVRGDDDGGYWTANDGNGPDNDAQDPGDWIPRLDTSRCPDGEQRSTWHGTHVAGLVAALANNSEGVGVAHGAQVLPVRVLGRCGGFVSDVLAGARWAAGLAVVPGAQALNPAAKVLNLSLGVPGRCDSISQGVVDEIRARGVSIVASTGNDFRTAITAPANCKGVVAVTAHTRSGFNASYANVGPGVALSAPGGEQSDPVMSTWNDGAQAPGMDVYSGLHGTSMGTPMVAGTLALMSSARPDLPMASLEALVRDAARGFPAGDYCVANPGECGSGLLDAGAAVLAAQNADATLPDLNLTQRMVSGTVATGQLVTYSILVTNSGGSTATLVDVSATVAGGLDLQSVTASPSAAVVTFDATTMRVQLPELAPGPGAVLVVNVTARVTPTGGSVSSAARVQAGGVELSGVNNSDVLVLSTQPMVAAAAPADSGGGCTVAPPGARGDAGLPLLLLLALILGCGRQVRGQWRKSASRRLPMQPQRPVPTNCP